MPSKNDFGINGVTPLIPKSSNVASHAWGMLSNQSSDNDGFQLIRTKTKPYRDLAFARFFSAFGAGYIFSRAWHGFHVLLQVLTGS